MKRFSHTFINLLFAGFFFLFLAGAEIVLRLQGTYPGFIYTGVKKVDSLEILPFYYADESGIEKLTPYAVRQMNSYVQTNELLSVENYMAVLKEDDLSSAVIDFYMLHHNLSTDSIEQIRKSNGIHLSTEEIADFDNKYNTSELGQKVKKLYEHGAQNAFDSLVINYVGNPINTDGFRSVDFNKNISGKKKVLLLGDSFTWGRSAAPIYNSFADILLARGYLVYNTGIVSTDPAQYLAVANRYIDSLSPDVVILNFFSGNDKMPFEHSVAPDKMRYHHTNAGLLSAYPLGYYMTAEEAYSYALPAAQIPITNFFNRICALSSISTKFWIYLYSKGWVDNNNPALQHLQQKGVNKATFPVSEKYISLIEKLCNERNTPLLISVIPDRFHYQDWYPEISAEQLFAGVPYYEIKKLEPHDYAGNGDDHFNNSGHLKYANFLQLAIDSLLSIHQPNQSK